MRDGESLLDQVIAYSGRHIAETDVLNIIGLVEKEVLYEIVATIFKGDLKRGLEAIEGILNSGYDAHQIHKGLVSTLRNMMVLKVCVGIPDFLYMSEKEYNRNLELLKNVEYYEVQNMLHYLLNAEDLLRGLFPKVALEVIYINLYNISRLRNVEKLIEGYGRTEVKREKMPEPRKEEPERGPAAVEQSPSEGMRDAGSFVQFLKTRRPFVGSVLEVLESRLENGVFVVFLDRMHGYLQDDTEQKEEIKAHLKEYFGTAIGLTFREGSEQKRSVLEDYVKEAETLFKI
jgi:DNA polymerase III, gamma/tau subunits